MSISNHPGRPLLAILLGACLLLPTAALAASHEGEKAHDAMEQEATDMQYKDKDDKAHDEMSADDKMMEDQEKMMEEADETMQEDDSM